MEEEERKQKLKAGKEKLARFRKKKKTKPQGNESEEQAVNQVDVTHDDVRYKDLSAFASPVPFDSEPQTQSSFSEEDISGTEDEPDSRSVLILKSQLRDTTERVTELEENLAGKQLALDKVIKENVKLKEEMATRNNKMAVNNVENAFVTHGSHSEENSTVLAAEFQLENQSTYLNENQSANMHTEAGNQTYSMADVQELIQHVQWLQLQLKQAGTMLEEQTQKQTVTSQALRQAKSDIISLQDNIGTKDAIVAQLATKLTNISTEYKNLKALLSTRKDTVLPRIHEVSGVDLEGEVSGVDLEGSIPELKENIEAGYVKQIETLTEDIKIFKENASMEKEDLLRALSYVKESNERTMEENEQLKLKNKNLDEKLNSIHIEMDLVEDDCRTVKLRLNETADKLEEAKKENVVAYQEKLVVSQQNSTFSDEIQSLKAMNSSISEEIQALTADKQDTDVRMKQLSDEICEMKEDRLSLEEELKRLTYELESMKLNNDRIENSNSALVSELDMFKAQLQSQESQISDYQSQLEDYENKISEASDAVEDNHSLRIQNDDLYNKINNQKDVIASLKAEMENLLCKNMQLIEQLQDLSSSEAQLKHNNNMLQKDKTQIKEELCSLKVVLLDTQRENSICKDVISGLNLEIETLKKELQNDSSESEKYKTTLSEFQSKDSYDPDEEEHFIKNSAQRSESINRELVQSVNPSSADEQYTISATIPVEEIFLTATNVPSVETSIMQHVKKIETTDDGCEHYTLNQLQEENKLLKEELLKLQASSLVRKASENAKDSEINQSQLHGASNESQYCDRTVSEMTHDDTAYQTYDFEPQKQSNSAEEIAFLRERISNLQQDYDRVNHLLYTKMEDYEMLKTELEAVKTGKMDRSTVLQETLDILGPTGIASTNVDKAAVYHSDPEVSDSCSIDASGKEVNLHASSALQTTYGFDLVVNSVVGSNVDYGFQNSDDVDQDCDGLTCSESQSNNKTLKSKLANMLKEKDELIGIIEKERKKLSFAIYEKEEFEELNKKYLKDLENQSVVIETMKATNQNLEDKILKVEITFRESKNENEKLEWHKNELELQVSTMEEKISTIQLENSSLSVKEEQVKDELNRVKERLEFLESSEADILEMREVTDAFQLERETLMKENMETQRLLIVEQHKNDDYSKDIQLLHQNHQKMLDKLEQENLEIYSQLEKKTSESGTLKQKVEDMGQQTCQLNGEIERLMNENLALKNRVQTLDTDSQNLKKDNKKLQSYFPNIDFQEEQLAVLNEKCRDMEDHAQKVSVTNEKMVIEITGLETKLQSISNENAFLLDKCDKLTNIIADMDNEKTDLLDQREKFEIRLNQVLIENTTSLQKKDHELEALVGENSTLKTEVINLKDDLKEVRERGNRVFENLTSQQTVEILEAKISDLQGENLDYQQKINALEQDLSGFVEQVQLYDDTLSEKADLATRLEHEINSLVEENSTLKTKNNILEHDLHEINENHTILKEHLKSYQSARNLGQSQVTDETSKPKLELEFRYRAKLQKDIETIQTENEQNQLQLKCFKEECETLRKKLSSFEHEKLSTHKLIDSLELEKQKLLEENDDMKTQILSSQSKCCESLKQIELLTSELETCQLYLQAVSENRNHIRNQVEILAAEIEALTVSKDHRTSCYFTLEKMNNNLKIEYENSVDSLLNIEKEHTELKIEHEKTTMHCSSLENLCSELKCENERIASQCLVLEKECNERKTENEKTASRCYNLESEHIALSKENEQYKKVVENIHEKIEKLDIAIGKNAELVSENDSLCKKVDEMEIQVLNVKKEKVELEKMIRELTNMLHDMQTKYEEVKSEMESTKKKCDKEIKKLQAQLQVMNDDVQELKNMLEIMENEVYDAAEEKLVLKENLQQQQDQYEEAVESKQKLEEILSEKHQKDVQNKITVLELMANRSSDTESVDTENVNIVCQYCQNSFVSSVSTSTQTDLVMSSFLDEYDSGLMDTDIFDEKSNFDRNVESALNSNAHFVHDFDKDEDTSNDTYTFETDANINSNIFETDREMCQSTYTNDFQCQVDLHKEDFLERFIVSEIQRNCYIPCDKLIHSEYNRESFGIENQPIRGLRLSLKDSKSKDVSEIQSPIPSIQEAHTHNIPAIDIASQMIKDEQNVFIFEKNTETDGQECNILRDQIVNGIVKITADEQTKLVETDTSIQTENIGTEFNSQECENEISNLSIDSGVFSAEKGTKFIFSTPYVLPNQSVTCHDNGQSKEQKLLSGKHYCASTQTKISALAMNVEISCQTDDFESEDIQNVRQELEARFETKCTELETEIEQRLIKDLDFREQKVKLQEENYERKIKQIEYELEEKYEQSFRMREVEITVKVEQDKRSYAREIEDAANRKIEKIKMEKDQQFMETMQKVRSDIKKHHRAEIAKLKAELDSDIGPGGERQLRGNAQENIIHKLNEENQDLALARDVLLRRANSSSLQFQALQLDLQHIMEDERLKGTSQPANQSLPAWLDWEISPDLSFGSVNSSIDEKSLSGSLDPSTFCANLECLSVRMKYEQLVERIRKFLISKQVDSSVSDTSTPRGDLSYSEKGECRNEIHNLDLSNETDRFVENTDPETSMLQRITSIHLEHSVRIPYSESNRATSLTGDQFVTEDMVDNREINDIILEHIVKESVSKEDNEKSNVAHLHQQGKIAGSKQVEGHFSETESDSEDEVISESSVTIDYDQLNSYNSESGTGVTDEDVHPFSECKFTKSVLRRHMSENELSDNEDLMSRKRCFSDSGIQNDRESENSVEATREKVRCLDGGSFVQEMTDPFESDTKALAQISSSKNGTDDVFKEPDRSSITEYTPAEKAEQYQVKHIELPLEQDKFIAEMSPVEDTSSASLMSVIDKSAVKDQVSDKNEGHFFEEVPSVARRKSGWTLTDLNFKFDSYSLDKDELKEEIQGAEILPITTLGTGSSSCFGDQNTNCHEQMQQNSQFQIRNGLSLSEELRLAFPVEGHDLFVNEDDKHDSGDILENLDSDPVDLSAMVSTEKQSYENTVFDVLNSICPGTNPVRREHNETQCPVFEKFENTTSEFSESLIEGNISELHSQSQYLKTELSSHRTITEYLNENCKQKEQLKRNISELKEQNEKLQQNLEDVRQKLQEQENELVEVKQDRDKAIVDKNTEGSRLVLLKNHSENKNSEMQAEQLKLQEQIMSLMNQVSVLENEKKELQDYVYGSDIRIRELKIQEEELNKQLLEMKQTNATLMIKVDTMGIQNEKEENLNEMIATLKNEIKNLNENINALEKEKAELHEKSGKLCLQIEQINVDTEKLIEQLEAKTSENQQCYIKMENFRVDTQELQRLITKSKETYGSLSSENKSLEAQILQLKDSCEIYANDQINLSQKLNTSEAKLLEQQRELDRCQSSLISKDEEIANLKVNFANFKDKAESDAVEFARELETKVTENKHCQLDKENLKSDVQELLKMMAKAEETNDSLSAENKSLVIKISQLKENFEKHKSDKTDISEKLKSYEEKLSLQQNELDKHQSSLASKDEEIANLTANFANFKNKADSDSEELNRQLEINVSENKHSQLEVQHFKSDIQELQRIIQESDIVNSSLDTENKSLEEKVQKLNERCERDSITITDLVQQIQNYEEKLLKQETEIQKYNFSLVSKEKEIKESFTDLKDKADIVVEERTKHKPDSSEPLNSLSSDKCTETENGILAVKVPESADTANEEINLLKSVNEKLELSLKRSKEINEENEWAINELAGQVDQLEKEKEAMNSKIEMLMKNTEQLQENRSKEVDQIISERNTEKCTAEILTEKLENLPIGTESNFNENSCGNDLNDTIRKVPDEKSKSETELQADHDMKDLSQRVRILEKENSDLSILITYNRETFDKEKGELIEMYNDLKSEVDALMETKKQLEEELCTLKELLESGLDGIECDSSRELTIEDLQDMEELKSSIENLKRDMKEKDNYVRKLEEHLLNLDRGLPDLTSAPKPTLSSGEPVVSKAVSRKQFSVHDFGRLTCSLNNHAGGLPTEIHNQVRQSSVAVVDKTELVDIEHSALSESKFVEELDKTTKNPFRSSVQSELVSVSSVRDSLETTQRIKSGLTAEEDGHYALELKQFELVDEISKLRHDFRETKAVYEHETALLTQALEREKAVTENFKLKEVLRPNDTSFMNFETTLSTDLVRARQDIALLRRENNILRIENERWLNRIKEQEQIVLDLRERLNRNTSGIEEIEEVFGKQLALLQKQREELLDLIKDREQENSTLSVTLGEKSIIEDSLRREKEILTAKLQEKCDLEKELNDKQIALEKQKLQQKQFEEVVYQKDLNERNLMRQKRILEEELLEIESKYRDREENLGFEKNQLLDELRERHRKCKSEMTDSQDDVRSVCSDSSISDQQISRLELMLEEVEKQHERAVKVLRDQLQSKYDRREKAMKEEHICALKELQLEHKKQVK